MARRSRRGGRRPIIRAIDRHDAVGSLQRQGHGNATKRKRTAQRDVHVTGGAGRTDMAEPLPEHVRDSGVRHAALRAKHMLEPDAAPTFPLPYTDGRDDRSNANHD